MTEPRPHRAACSPARQPTRSSLSTRRKPRWRCRWGRAGRSGSSRSAVTTGPAGLSEREIEVLRLLARGQTERQIAARLTISASTAHTHVVHSYEKAGDARARSVCNSPPESTAEIDPEGGKSRMLLDVSAEKCKTTARTRGAQVARRARQ